MTYSWVPSSSSDRRRRHARLALGIVASLSVACGADKAAPRDGGGGQGGGLSDGGARDGNSHDGAGGLGGPCWTASDCATAGISTCTAPGQLVCGGACLAVQHPCSVDTDCANPDGGPPSVCDPVACSCPAGKGCQAGCRGDAECPSWESCGTDHRCAPRACGPGGGACPTDFACGSDGHCARKGCTSDGECSNACVDGACYDRPGICTAPVP